MHLPHKSTPGPRAVSCLTCRQRRKKCDKARPFCGRCLNSDGKFTCLGYGDETEPEVVEPPRQKERMRVEPVEVSSLTQIRVGVEFEEAMPNYHARSAYFGFPVSVSDMNDYLSPSVDSLMVPGPPASSLLTAAPVSDEQGAGWTQITRNYKPSNVIMLPLPLSIPRGVNANQQMRESYLVFMLGIYETHRIDKFFRVPFTMGRDLLVKKMKQSPRALGYMYLGAKIFETLNAKTEEAAIESCSHWVANYSNHVSTPDDVQNPYPTISEVEVRVYGLIELFFLQLVILGTAAGYTTLRLALSSFLRLVSDDPRLWAEQVPGDLSVSLPAALTSNRTEITRFVFYDIMCAFALGLPTLAQYDPTGFSVAPGADIPVEWVHGVPVELIINIAAVHNWRAQTGNADWQELEMRTLAWRWSQRTVYSEESAEMVHRAAVQEGWRHTTLIYIYMGICGVTSHDPRVQASVHQIIRLMEVVGDTIRDVHFAIPSIVAGLAARYESQRALIHQKLKTFSGMKLMTVRGRDFVRVLECLWHGPAVDGAAVVWDHYIQARRQVLPIP